MQADQAPSPCKDVSTCSGAGGCETCQGTGAAEPTKRTIPPPPDREQIALLGIPELITRYHGGITHFHRSILHVPDAELDTFFRPEAGVGRWSIRVLLGHIADSELAFTTRLRRTVAEDHPVLAVMDEDAYIDSGLYCDFGTADGAQGEASGGDKPIAGFLGVIHTLRMWTSQWLATLDDNQWLRTALHPQEGEVSVRDLLVKAVWHLEHHAWFLAKKLEKLDEAAQPPAE